MNARPTQRPSPPLRADLVRDAILEAWRSGWTSTLSALQAVWPAPIALPGPMPDHLACAPEDLRPARLEDADAIFRGRFRLPSGTVALKNQAVWDIVPPNKAWAEELHSFMWLRHFSEIGGEASIKLARQSVSDWIARYGRGHEVAWRPHIVAQRLTAWASHHRLVFGKADILWRSAVLHSMVRQARHLQRTVRQAPDGEPRITAAIGLAMSGLTLPDGVARLRRGLEALTFEVSRQILPDGGHVSRNPESVLRILIDLLTLSLALKEQDGALPDKVRSAIDRMTPALRFFRHGDERLSLFNGGTESTERMIDAVLSRDDARGKPFGFAPHSGYHRLSAGNSIVLLDVGGPPPASFSAAAHAGALSFELSHGPDRIIVNCGATYARGDDWREAGRATAAHSTLILDNKSSASILAQGLPARILGPRLFTTGGVTSRRNESEGGIWIDSSHRGYVRSYGVIHERRLYLATTGEDLRGEDSLVPLNDARQKMGNRRKIPFAVRFHVHPDTRLSLAQDGSSVILLLPSGEGWRFRATGGTIALDESIYLGTADAVRRTEQIVVTGEFTGEVARIQWALRHVPADA
jgi:uncharacterized heparinase superfamily protein